MTAEIFAVNLCPYSKTGFTMSAEKKFWNQMYMRSQTRQPFLKDLIRGPRNSGSRAAAAPGILDQYLSIQVQEPQSGQS